MSEGGGERGQAEAATWRHGLGDAPDYRYESVGRTWDGISQSNQLCGTRADWQYRLVGLAARC